MKCYAYEEEAFRHSNQNMAFAAELAAEFISRPQNQEVVEGQKAEFTCSVSKETYNVKWMKDNKELEEGEKYQMISDGKRRSLVIKNCEPKDEGGYVVVIGATRASADLTVQGKPRLIKDLDILLDLFFFSLAYFYVIKFSQWTHSCPIFCFEQRN